MWSPEDLAVVRPAVIGSGDKTVSCHIVYTSADPARTEANTQGQGRITHCTRARCPSAASKHHAVKVK